VSSVVAEGAARRIAIPINANAESLNVAIATGILLFALGGT
jgi:tRNA G18 (ribose-2'-O)-methylase SpoU